MQKKVQTYKSLPIKLLILVNFPPHLQSYEIIKYNLKNLEYVGMFQTACKRCQVVHHNPYIYQNLINAPHIPSFDQSHTLLPVRQTPYLILYTWS